MPTFSKGDVFVVKSTEPQSGGVNDRTLTYQGETDGAHDFLVEDSGRSAHMLFSPDMGIVRDETRSMNNSPSSAPMPWPLQEGAKKRFNYKADFEGAPYDHKTTATVGKMVRMHVPAGDFDCYPVEITDKIPAAPAWSDVQTWWYSPKVGFFVKMESKTIGGFELVSYQHNSGSVAMTDVH